MNSFNSIIKKNWGRIIALLSNYLYDLDLAEDAMQDALESALIHWRKNGIPENPQAWLLTTAKHKALDKIRRARNFESKKKDYLRLLQLNESSNKEDFFIADERLRLIFTCCHPALAKSTSVALTLRLLGGLTTQEIASAYLVSTQAMAQRIVRGKRKIKKAGISYVLPEKDNFQLRLGRVLTVIYLIFNEGYCAANNTKLIRQCLCVEAIRLGKILLNLCPQESEVKGLLSLMLLHDSRVKARFNSQGDFISLEKQDRSRWNKLQIKQGTKLLKSALGQKSIGSYQIQAAISALHCEASSFKKTDWHQIVLLYEELLKITPSSIIKLNQLMAKSHIAPAQDVLKELNELEEQLLKYHPFYVAKAELLVILKKPDEAYPQIKKALRLCQNSTIKSHLESKLKLFYSGIE